MVVTIVHERVGGRKSLFQKGVENIGKRSKIQQVKNKNPKTNLNC